MQLRAIAIHVDKNDSVLAQQDDDWLIEDCSAAGVLRIKNSRTGDVGLLGSDYVQSYFQNAARGPEYGHLRLLAQTFVVDGRVIFEPVSRPGERLEYRPHSLVSEALLEASLDCHYWKILLMETLSQRAPLPDGAEGEFVDVWDLMEAKWIPSYSSENYRLFTPLFMEGLTETRRRFDRLLTLFQRVLPSEFQAQLVRGGRQLSVEQQAYIFLPSLPTVAGTQVDLNEMFRGRFVGAIDVLRRCSREADRRRDELKATAQQPATSGINS